jgi:hypothetical protein
LHPGPVLCRRTGWGRGRRGPRWRWANPSRAALERPVLVAVLLPTRPASWQGAVRAEPESVPGKPGHDSCPENSGGLPSEEQ